MFVIRASGSDLKQSRTKLVGDWGNPILARGAAYDLNECEIYIAGAMDGLAAISRRDEPFAELVAINSYVRHRGTGTMLVNAIVSDLRNDGFEKLRLTTTNDNIDALRFYQRRGFRLEALRPGAVDKARAHKPTIPTFGEYAIPIRDELDLVLALQEQP